MALPPHIVALGQKREPKRRVIFRAKEENDVTPDYEAEAICWKRLAASHSIWQTVFFIRQMTMISDGFSVRSFILSRLASSSITKKVPEP
jgi:hypothetical protein